MEENRDYTAYIDAYLEGNLSGDELKEFENQLKENVDFALEVKAHQILINTVQQRSIEEKLKAFEASFIPDKTSLIDAYLGKELTEELLELVENKIRDDEQFKDEIEAQKLLIEQVKRDFLKGKLKTFEDSLSEEKEEKTSPVFKVERPQEEKSKEVKFYTSRTFAAAASICVILLAAIFMLKDYGDEPTNTIVSTYTIKVENINEGLGFADDGESEVEVEVIKNKELKGYYEFEDKTLKIYSSEKISNIKLEFDATSDPSFLLKLDGKKYLIDYTSKPTQLK
ncbi:hypothetical protein [Flammeovirga sp. SubArs3]|uniref:hypothetical protein n=1 Tax=Flammeovirga sp. SubArs3 TaxID=2995316 RepID=UPI00248C54F4|nr:hypothetical protein [Flammeovirga sp. SubArs3]